MEAPILGDHLIKPTMEVPDLDWFDKTIISAILIISVGIGFYFYIRGDKITTIEEYCKTVVHTDKRVLTLSLVTTFQAEVTILESSAVVYMFGTQASVASLGMLLGAVIAVYAYLPVFYNLKDISIYAYLEKRFGKITKYISLMLAIIHMVLFASVMLYAPANAMSDVTGLERWLSVVSLCIICVLYTILGGIKAVIWCTAFQFVVMSFSLLTIIITGTNIVGGVGKVLEIASSGGRINFFNFDLDPTVRFTFWNTFTSGILVSLATYGTSQSEVQRLIGVDTLRDSRRAVLWSIPIKVIVNISICMIGLVVYSHSYGCDPMLMSEETKVVTQEQLLPYHIMKLFGNTPGLSGFCIAGILCSYLSAVSLVIISLTTVTVADAIEVFNKNQLDPKVYVAKLLTVFYGSLCLILTVVLYTDPGFIAASHAFMGTFASCLLGVFTLGLFTKRVDQISAIVGLIAGFVINMAFELGANLSSYNHPLLAQSTHKCYDASNSTIIAEIYANGNSTIEEEEQYVFPLFKVSDINFEIFGFLTVVVTGYLCSFVLGIRKEISSELLTPVITRWHRQYSDVTLSELSRTSVTTLRPIDYSALFKKLMNLPPDTPTKSASDNDIKPKTAFIL